MYCGIHAVNNVAQRCAMQKKDFDAICVDLVKQSSQRSWVNPHRSLFGIGNYDVRADTAN